MRPIRNLEWSHICGLYTWELKYEELYDAKCMYVWEREVPHVMFFPREDKVKEKDGLQLDKDIFS